MRSLIIATALFPATTLFAAEYEITIPSDPKAKYYVIEKGGTKDNPTLTTKRVGQSGTSYSKRVFNCSARTVKYLGEGDTLEEMKRAKSGSKMGPLVEGSIAWYLWRHACNK